MVFISNNNFDIHDCNLLFFQTMLRVNKFGVSHHNYQIIPYCKFLTYICNQNFICLTFKISIVYLCIRNGKGTKNLALVAYVSLNKVHNL